MSKTAEKICEVEFTYRPLGDKVLIRRDKPQDKVGNILLPDNAQQQRTRTGTVLAVGPGRVMDNEHNRHTMELEEGDRVVFNQYAGNEIAKGAYGKTAESDLIVMREDDVLAVITQHERKPRSKRGKRQ